MPQGKKVMINKIIILTTIILLISPVLAQEKRPEEIYKNLLPSIVTLTVEKKDGSGVTGTAFLAIKDGIAVTALHVVRNAKRVTANFSNGDEYEVTGLIDKDEKRDLALIRIKTFGKPLLRFVTAEPAIGSKVYVIGAPKGLEFSISDGLLSQIQNIDRVNNYQFSCPASPGNSGGPLVNASGEVLGVVSWQLREGQNLNFAIPSTYVLGLDSTLSTQAWETIRVVDELVFRKDTSTGTIDEVAGTYTGSWASNDYNVSGSLVLTITVVNKQPQVQAVFTGSEYFNEDILLATMTSLGQGVWKMDYTGKRSKISGTGLFKAGKFVGDYRFRKLLWIDRGRWVLTKTQ